MHPGHTVNLWQCPDKDVGLLAPLTAMLSKLPLEEPFPGHQEAEPRAARYKREMPWRSKA